MLREEDRLRVFENRVLREVFGVEREEEIEEWKEMCDGELQYLYCSSDIIRVVTWRRMGWDGMGRTCGILRREEVIFI
jgi:hypothetical protein